MNRRRTIKISNQFPACEGSRRSARRTLWQSSQALEPENTKKHENEGNKKKKKNSLEARSLTSSCSFLAILCHLQRLWRTWKSSLNSKGLLCWDFGLWRSRRRWVSLIMSSWISKRQTISSKKARCNPIEKAQDNMMVISKKLVGFGFPGKGSERRGRRARW